MPHGALSATETSATQVMRVVEAPLSGPLNCADATCGKGSPAPAAPSPGSRWWPSGRALRGGRGRLRPAPAWAACGPPRRGPGPAVPPSPVLLARPAPARPAPPPAGESPGRAMQSRRPCHAASISSLRAWAPRRRLGPHRRRTPCRNPQPAVAPARTGPRSEDQPHAAPRPAPSKAAASPPPEPLPLPSPGPGGPRAGGGGGGGHRHHDRGQGGRQLRPIRRCVVPPATVGAASATPIPAPPRSPPRSWPRSRCRRRRSTRWAARLGRPAHRDRERHRPARRSGQAADHLRRRRVLPLLRRGTVVAGGGAVAVRDVPEPVGHTLVGQRRVPRHADPVVLRVDLFQPVRRLPGRRGGHEPAGRGHLPGPPDADGGADRR